MQGKTEQGRAGHASMQQGEAGQGRAGHTSMQGRAVQGTRACRAGQGRAHKPAGQGRAHQHAARQGRAEQQQAWQYYYYQASRHEVPPEIIHEHSHETQLVGKPQQHCEATGMQ